MPLSEQGQREAIGARVREARQYLGMSQEDVAQALGIQRSAVSQLESGGRGIDVVELTKLASLLGRDLDSLTGSHTKFASDGTVEMLARTTSGLSSSDVDELQRFASYLRARAGPTKHG